MSKYTALKQTQQCSSIAQWFYTVPIFVFEYINRMEIAPRGEITRFCLQSTILFEREIRDSTSLCDRV